MDPSNYGSSSRLMLPQLIVIIGLAELLKGNYPQGVEERTLAREMKQPVAAVHNVLLSLERLELVTLRQRSTSGREVLVNLTKKGQEKTSSLAQG